MDHRWVCLTIFLVLMADTARSQDFLQRFQYIGNMYSDLATAERFDVIDIAECARRCYEATDYYCQSFEVGYNAICYTNENNRATTSVNMYESNNFVYYERKEVDECAEGTANCSPQATCSNVTPGSFTCSCNAGYTGNGVTCTDIDACLANPCDAQATCTDNPAPALDATCTCNTGYTGDGLVSGTGCAACSTLYSGLNPSHNFGVYQNQCFWSGSFRTPRLNYMAAKQACQDEGGTLAMIKDEATQTFLRTHLRGTSGHRQRSYWIGLDDRDAEGTFLWNDGTPLGEYDEFRSDAPNRARDCVTLWRTRRVARWDIRDCSVLKPYICQLGGNGSK
ncbi:neurocan core protein-like [Branchiostoma floridae]|uniref:Neurocan core protein-like n=1 Tax=Branchiostoma floridae TaxID=7739 RepID=A0A9J7KVT8_BRAFL|nr:neurocan core protein-like [Branchiostoma floridae]